MVATVARVRVQTADFDLAAETAALQRLLPGVTKRGERAAAA